MSRELEFRAWDKLRNEYLSGGRVLIQVNTGSAPKKASELYLDTTSQGCCERMIVEQFTGLLDCNDKKIFEGDVLMSKCGEKAFVYFFDGSFMVRIGKYYPVKTHQAYMKDNQFKVVGNIHEAKL